MSNSIMEGEQELGGDRRQSFEIENNASELTLSTSRYMALTCGLGGLQVVWATIFSNGTPFMLSLGLPERMTSVVWAAAPVCGCFGQIYVGWLSDQCRHRWGRRRPFIAVGAAVITVSLITLAWSSVLALWITRLYFWDLSLTTAANSLTPTIAVISFWILSLGIQPLQCGLRALVLDVCSPQQQSATNIWAIRFIGVGNILGCSAGTFGIPGLNFDMTARFRLLSVLSFLAVDITAAITCLSIRETRAAAHGPPKAYSLLVVTRDLITTYLKLSKRSRQILLVQFISWLSWFGFLFYTSSYVGNLFMDRGPTHEMAAQARSHDVKSQYGTFTNLLIAITSLFVSVFLPSLTKLLVDDLRGDSKEWQNSETATMQIPATVWSFSLMLGSLLLFATIFTTDAAMASTLMILMGIPWAVQNWAPFTLFGISSLKDLPPSENKSNSGTLMGLHNMAITFPQIIAAGVCSAIIPLAQSLHSMDSLGWVMRFGGLALLVASYYAFELSRSLF